MKEMDGMQRERRLLGLLSFLGGISVLGGTWLFYRERLGAPGFDLLSWVQPALLTIGGLLGVLGAGLVLARHPRGQTVLGLAVGTIPLILAARLIVVVLRGLGLLGRSIADGGFLAGTAAIVDRARLNPLSLAINLTILIVLIVVAVLRTARQSGESPEMHDRGR
jgi:hypothetical protein